MDCIPGFPRRGISAALGRYRRPGTLFRNGRKSCATRRTAIGLLVPPIREVKTLAAVRVGASHGDRHLCTPLTQEQLDLSRFIEHGSSSPWHGFNHVSIQILTGHFSHGVALSVIVSSAQRSQRRGDQSELQETGYILRWMDGDLQRYLSTGDSSYVPFAPKDVGGKEPDFLRAVGKNSAFSYFRSGRVLSLVLLVSRTLVGSRDFAPQVWRPFRIARGHARRAAWPPTPEVCALPND
jgi:hypothetical protein